MRPITVALCFVLGACGGGGVATLSPGGDRPPSSSDLSSGGTDQAPASVDQPPSSTDSPPSSQDPAGGAGGVIPLCIGAPDAITACLTCVDTTCGSAFRAAVSACRSFLNCYAACNCSDGKCIESCGGAATSDCVSAAIVAGKCAKKSCQDACSSSSITIGPGDAGGMTVSNGGMGMGSGPGGGGCGALSSCCPSLPKVEQTSCNQVVSLGSSSSCAQALSGYQNAGQCP